jgi:hypothetical protein
MDICNKKLYIITPDRRVSSSTLDPHLSMKKHKNKKDKFSDHAILQAIVMTFVVMIGLLLVVKILFY